MSVSPRAPASVSCVVEPVWLVVAGENVVGVVKLLGLGAGGGEEGEGIEVQSMKPKNSGGGEGEADELSMGYGQFID